MRLSPYKHLVLAVPQSFWKIEWDMSAVHCLQRYEPLSSSAAPDHSQRTLRRHIDMMPCINSTNEPWAERRRHGNHNFLQDSSLQASHSIHTHAQGLKRLSRTEPQASDDPVSGLSSNWLASLICLPSQRQLCAVTSVYSVDPMDKQACIAVRQYGLGQKSKASGQSSFHQSNRPQT